MKAIATSLAKGQVTQEVLCQGKWVVFAVKGTLDVETLTIEASPDGGLNWFTYRTDDTTGAAESATITSTDVSSGLYSRIYVAGDLRLRGSLSNGAGTVSGVNVYVGGAGVQIDPASVQA
jgi:hypothetical protein